MLKKIMCYALLIVINIDHGSTSEVPEDTSFDLHGGQMLRQNYHLDGDEQTIAVFLNQDQTLQTQTWAPNSQQNKMTLPTKLKSAYDIIQSRDYGLRTILAIPFFSISGPLSGIDNLAPFLDTQDLLIVISLPKQLDPNNLASLENQPDILRRVIIAIPVGINTDQGYLEQIFPGAPFESQKITFPKGLETYPAYLRNRMLGVLAENTHQACYNMSGLLALGQQHLSCSGPSLMKFLIDTSHKDPERYPVNIVDPLILIK